MVEHRQYCNDSHANMTAEEKGQPPVLWFQAFNHVDKVPIVMYQWHVPFSYGVYIKVDNDLIPATKTISLPMDTFYHYAGEGVVKKFIKEIAQIGTLVKDIYSQSEPM
ncbi:hypothetical protein PR048_017709 [Dryococelus australis]|uniref:Uncharacterized protein n=1 Tax=Dryococelus australis TaxID=614101 RepID=A0ABQ9HAA5_9NEOP|nr:hypothetical protein PR048_017709 [Dryococelus australis]